MRNDDGTEHVDLELSAQLIDRKKLERTGDGDAGIVDDAAQRDTARGNDPCSSIDGAAVGDVETNGSNVLVQRCDFGTVRILANAGEGNEAPASQQLGGRGPDAARRARYEDGLISDGLIRDSSTVAGRRFANSAPDLSLWKSARLTAGHGTHDQKRLGPGRDRVG